MLAVIFMFRLEWCGNEKGQKPPLLLNTCLWRIVDPVLRPYPKNSRLAACSEGEHDDALATPARTSNRFAGKSSKGFTPR